MSDDPSQDRALAIHRKKQELERLRKRRELSSASSSLQETSQDANSSSPLLSNAAAVPSSSSSSSTLVSSTIPSDTRASPSTSTVVESGTPALENGRLRKENLDIGSILDSTSVVDPMKLRQNKIDALQVISVLSSRSIPPGKSVAETYPRDTQTDLSGEDLESALNFYSSSVDEHGLRRYGEGENQRRRNRRIGSDGLECVQNDDDLRDNRLRTEATSTSISGEESDEDMELGRDASFRSHTKLASMDSPLSSSLRRYRPTDDSFYLMEEDEARRIEQSNDFQEFFRSKLRVMERAIASSETFDIFKDFTTRQTKDESDHVDLLRILHSYSNENSISRPILSMDWSRSASELFLVSHHLPQRHHGIRQNGLVHVWDLSVSSSPEMSFVADFPVLEACFHPKDPSLVIGGMENGQLVVWDMRSGSRPDLTTPLSVQGLELTHTTSVVGLKVFSGVDDEIISISSNGRACKWELANLVLPRESADLRGRDAALSSSTGSSSIVNPLCVGFLQRDSSSFIVGTNDGSLHSCSSLRSLEVEVSFSSQNSHFGPITSCSIHPNAPQGAPDCSPFVLTTGMDWTCRLWDSRTRECFHIFEHFSDYVYQSCWSPVHPGVFLAVDGSSVLSLWDLSRDLETPIAEHVLSSEKSNPSPLNRVAWSPDGKYCITGGVTGDVTAFRVGLEDPDRTSFERFAVAMERARQDRL